MHLSKTRLALAAALVSAALAPALAQAEGGLSYNIGAVSLYKFNGIDQDNAQANHGRYMQALDALQPFRQQFPAALQRRMNAKLGLTTVQAGDEALTESLMQLLAQGAVDFSIFWRRLSLAAATHADPAADPERAQAAIEPVRDLFLQPEAFDAWALAWRERLRSDPGFEPLAAQTRMLATNPQVVLRNHLGETVIQHARQGDWAPLHRLQAALAQPFTALPGHDDLADFPPDWAARIEISCSS